MKLLLLDLDGTVRKPISDSTFIQHPEDQQIIPNAGWAIARYFKQGWQIVGITNQAGVAFSLKTFRDAVTEQRVTLRLVPQMSTIYFCPYKDGEDSGCFRVKLTGMHGEIDCIPNTDPTIGFRKPNPGMLLRAIFDQRVELADKGVVGKPRKPFVQNDEITYVGDRPEDEQAAAAGGIKFKWASDWYQDGN